MKTIKARLFCVLAINSAIVAGNNCATAQVIPDTTLGSESSTTQIDSQFPVDVIGGGATRGANLFHIAPSALFFNGNAPAEIVNRSSATTSVLELIINGLQVTKPLQFVISRW